MVKEVILESQQLNSIKRHFPPLSFQSATFLCYQNQIPHVAMVALDNSLELHHMDSFHKKVQRQSLVGIGHLLTRTPLPFGIKISPGGKVALIDRTRLLSSLNDCKDLGFLLPHVFK